MPDEKGFFGEFGGRFVDEKLDAELQLITDKFLELINNQAFNDEYNDLLKNYVGRPSLYFAGQLAPCIVDLVRLQRNCRRVVLNVMRPKALALHFVDFFKYSQAAGVFFRHFLRQPKKSLYALDRTAGGFFGDLRG